MGNFFSRTRGRRTHRNANYRATVGNYEQEKPLQVPSASLAYDDCDDNIIDFEGGNNSCILLFTTCCASVCTLIVLLSFILYYFTTGLD